MVAQAENKICPKCEVEKPRTKEFFYFSFVKGKGLVPCGYCKDCLREYTMKRQNENIEHYRAVKKESQRKYYEKNKEELRRKKNLKQKKEVEILSDRIIKKKLYAYYGITAKEADENPELIKIQRTKTLINRKLKDLKNGI